MRKRRLLFFGLLVLAVLAFALEISLISAASVTVTTRLVILILLNVNVIALLTLMFFVTKNLIKLYLERKRKVLGSRFKTRLLVIFVVLTSIPSLLLFLGASGLVNTYIDRWFTPQFRQPLDSSLAIARSLYDLERRKTLDAAQAVVARGALPLAYTVTDLSEMPENASEVVREAFEGKEGTEVISDERGDVVRAVVPDVIAGKQGVVIVESRIPREITQSIGTIKTAYEDYLTLEAWKIPLKLNYLLLLGFFTLFVIFTALWLSLRLARGITEPIQGLAQATADVASGNLDVRIDRAGDDEIGLLITSFNHMVQELREGKESLQRAYRESDRRRLTIETILENIQSGVISLDADGNCITTNRAACFILGVPPEAVLGKNYREILSAIQSDSLQEFVKGIRLKTLESAEREVWATIKGKRMFIKISIMGLRDVLAQYLGLLVVFTDLTDIMKAQRALAWQEVARRIAHEIKNPLTPIKLSTERMLKKWEQKDADFGPVFERSTKTIIKEVEGLKALVDEFSRFGKMPEITKSPTVLAGIIDEVVTLYHDFKDVSITLSIPQEMPSVEIDREQFKRVLINLFDNAMHAMHGNGKVEITVRPDLPSNKVFIDVADNGPGIREEDKDKLFLPYFSTRSGGTGLGLAIASRIITEHRGYLRVADNEPWGTVFSIEIPIKEQ